MLATVLLTTGIAAFAAEPNTEAKKGQSAHKQDAQKEKRICRSEKLTGSLTRVRRVCLTRSEWDRLAEGTRKNVHELERDANQVQAVHAGGG